MANVYVMHENYLDAATQTYTSQQTAMPISNVLLGVRRTKVWRTNGYWEITSANKVIIFREAVGVDLTATIAESNYSTDATFLAAIKTALEAAGLATYTVARDTTSNRIKITSDLGGGATVFQLQCADVAFTAASTLGFSAVTLTGAATYTADVLKIHTSEWVKWDLGVGFNPKAFCIVGLRNESFKISAGATVKLQGSTTDSWTSPEYDVTLGHTDFGMGVFSSTGLHTQALRYWRLHITDASNGFGYVEISKIYLGDSVVTTQGAVQFPLRTSLVDYGERTIAKSGVTFNDTVQLTELIDFEWGHLTKSEKDELEDFIREVGLSTPFLICLDPSEAFSGEFERHIRLVKFENGPTFSLDTPNNFSSDWSLREEV